MGVVFGMWQPILSNHLGPLPVSIVNFSLRGLRAGPLTGIISDMRRQTASWSVEKDVICAASTLG